MRRSLRLLSAGVAVVATGTGTSLLLAHSGTASAAGPDPAHVVVYRVGAVGGTLTNAAAPVFLDRYTTSGTSEGTITVPTADAGGQHALTATGLSRSEGRLSLSPDGTLLAFTGYDVAPGTNGPAAQYDDVNGQPVNVTESLTASDPTTVARTVGLLDGSDATDTSTALTGAGVPHLIRAAATVDGNRLWLGGTDSGVLTTTRGSATASSVLTDSGLDATALGVAGGQLLATGGYDKQPDKRVVAVGGGTPTTAGAVTGLTGLPANLLPGGFAALNLTADDYAGTGLDTLYVANATEKAGVVDKFVWDGATWAKQGAIGLDGVLSLTAKATGSTVQLAATTPTGLWSFTEDDATAAGFTTSTPTQVATAPTGTEFRGVALAPTGDALAKPTVSITSPTGGAHVANNATSLHVTGTASALRGIGSVSVAVDSGTPVAATVTGGTWAADVSVSGLTVGAHSLKATAADTGNTPVTADSSAVGFTKDAAPAVGISSPTAGQHVSYLASSLVVKGTATAYRGISQVTVKVDNGAAAAATLSGTAWSRTLTVSSLPVGSHTLTIVAKETTSGATTTVTRSFVRDGVPAGALGPGSYSYTNRLVSKSTGWTVVGYTASPDRRALRTTGTSYVRFTSYGRSLDLHFQRRPDAGKVKIVLDGHVYVLDLRGTSADVVKAFRGLTAGKHSLTVQALHQHSAGSTGYVVVLGSLRVYA